MDLLHYGNCYAKWCFENYEFVFNLWKWSIRIEFINFNEFESWFALRKSFWIEKWVMELLDFWSIDIDEFEIMELHYLNI